MTPIKKIVTKRGHIQYHEYKMHQMRSFRISAAEAEIKLSTDQSYLVDKFWYEEDKPVLETEVIEETEQHKEQPVMQKAKSNIVTFSDRLKAKQDQINLEKAKIHFINNILPNMKMEEKQTILSNPDMIQEILLNVMIRTTVEKM